MKRSTQYNKTISNVYSDKECTKQMGRIIIDSKEKFFAIYFNTKMPYLSGQRNNKNTKKNVEQQLADRYGKPIYVVDFA